MLTLLKLIQSIIKTLHSDGTPGQVAAGIALGAALGRTPLVNVHNLLVFALIVLLNVSVGRGMLGWALFVPLGFLLDPVFDRPGGGPAATTGQGAGRSRGSAQAAHRRRGARDQAPRRFKL